MKQFQPCQSLEETLRNLGITEQHFDVGESVFPTYVGMQRQQVLEATEHLKGGKGDGKQDVEFDPKELAMGVEVEREHTNNALTAKEIAKDHLSEIPDYYTRLKNMEAQADTPADEPKPEDNAPEDVQEEAKESKEEWRLQATSPSLEGILNLLQTRMYQTYSKLVPDSEGVWKIKNGLSEFGLPFLPGKRVIKKKDRFRVEFRNTTPEEDAEVKSAMEKWRAHEAEHRFGSKDGKPIQKESTSWRLEEKPLHKKQHHNDVNIIVVMMPDDEHSKGKQEASDLVLRKEAIELCSMDAEEIYGTFPHDEWDEAMKIAKGLIEEVNQARAERASEDNE
jgi:hypothetical protein